MAGAGVDHPAFSPPFVMRREPVVFWPRSCRYTQATITLAMAHVTRAARVRTAMGRVVLLAGFGTAPIADTRRASPVGIDEEAHEPQWQPLAQRELRRWCQAMWNKWC